jgi:hypothetical protein
VSPTDAINTSSKPGEPLTGRKSLRFPLREQALGSMPRNGEMKCQMIVVIDQLGRNHTAIAEWCRKCSCAHRAVVTGS